MIRNLSFHVTSGSMLRSYANCWVIPQSTCYSFAVFFISSLHLMPCLQLGKDPALLKKKNQHVRVTNTRSALDILCLDRWPSWNEQHLEHDGVVELVQSPKSQVMPVWHLIPKLPAVATPCPELDSNPSLCPESDCHRASWLTLCYELSDLLVLAGHFFHRRNAASCARCSANWSWPCSWNSSLNLLGQRLRRGHILPSFFATKGCMNLSTCCRLRTCSCWLELKVPFCLR